MFPFGIKTQLINLISRSKNGFQDDDVLKLLLHPNLKELVLSTSTITDTFLQTLFESCKNLQILDLKSATNKFTTEGLLKSIPELKNLTGLKIRNSEYVTDAVITKIAQNCRFLKGLDIGGCSNVTDESIAYLKDLKLVQLNLSGSGITDRSLKMLSDCECGNSLIDLNVNDCNITEVGLKCIRWNNIKYIGFQRCKINDINFIEKQDPKNLSFIQWTIPN